MLLAIPRFFKRLHWPLVLRAAVAALAWYLLPDWMFWVVALGLYFIPLFRPLELLFPFLLTLAFAYVVPHTPVTAAAVGILMFLIFGIKDLILIDRVTGYEILAVVLLAVSGFEYFRRLPSFEDPAAAFAAGAVFYLLLRGFLSYAARAVDDPQLAAASERLVRPAAGVGALVLTEWTWTLMLAPLTQFLQTALFILCFALLIELLFGYVRRTLTRSVLLGHVSTFLVFGVILLAMNQWGL